MGEKPASAGKCGSEPGSLESESQKRVGAKGGARWALGRALAFLELGNEDIVVYTWGQSARCGNPPRRGMGQTEQQPWRACLGHVAQAGETWCAGHWKRYVLLFERGGGEGTPTHGFTL